MTNKLTQQNFIKRSSEKHADKYDYSKVKYATTYDKIDIICNMHGVFKQTAADHLYGGYGCPSCKFENNAKIKTTKARKSFEQKARKKHVTHQCNYDYSCVDYVNAKTRVNIKCKIHGMFSVTPNKHLSGWGCAGCSYDDKKLSTLEFIERSKEKHGNRYLYTKTEYQDYYTEVLINCKIHGDFLQTPERHIHTLGCPKCSFRSKGEFWIAEILDEQKIEFVKEKTFKKLNTNTSFPRFDFWLPKLSILIEYDGKQHFKPHKFANHQTDEYTQTMFKRIQILDKKKNKFAQENGMTLVRIPYTINTKPKIEATIIQAIQEQQHQDTLE